MNSEKLSTNYEGVVNNPLANEQPKLNDRMKHSRATSEEDIASSGANDSDGADEAAARPLHRTISLKYRCLLLGILVGDAVAVMQ